IIGILEALCVRMLEDRSQRDRRFAADPFGPVAAAQDGEQRLNQLLIDDREITCKLGGEKEIGLRGTVIPKEVEQHLPGTFGPVPGWRVQPAFTARGAEARTLALAGPGSGARDEILAIVWPEWRTGSSWLRGLWRTWPG